MRRLRRLPHPRKIDLFGGAIGNIGRNRIIEQHDILTHQRHLPPQVSEFDFGQKVSIEINGTCIRCKKSRQQIDDAGFTSTGRADQRDGFTRLNRQREIL